MKATVAMAVVYLFRAALCHAESHGEKSVREQLLPTVVVTATRLKGLSEEAITIPAKATVITAADIERLGAKTVQEALQYQSGIVHYDQIGNEFQSTVDLRGFNGQPVPMTSVFVDGVRVNEPDFNTINFDLIPVESIERMEILPGTATMFGRNALGGVINITTKRGRRDKSHFSLETAGGSFGRQKHTLTSDGPLPLADSDYQLTVTRELTDGFREASGGRITRLFGKLGYQSPQGADLALSYTRVQDHLKQAGSLPESVLRGNRKKNLTPGDFSEADHNLVSLNFRQELSDSLSFAVNGFVRENKAESFVVGLFGEFRAQFDLSQWGGTAQLTQDNRFFGRRNLLNLGVEYGHNRFSNHTRGSFVANKSTGENVVGAYLMDRFHLSESVQITGGFRYDWDRLDFRDRITKEFSFRKAFQQLSPRAGVTYNPLPDLTVYLGYSQGFRTPAVDEFSSFGPPPSFSPSVTELDPVKAQNFELGTTWRPLRWLEGSLAFFYMPVKDEIFFVVTDPSTFTGRNDNIERSLRRGMEASMKARYGRFLDAFLNYTLTKTTFETDVLLFSGQVREGNEFPLVPRHRVGIGTTFHPFDQLAFSVLGSYVGSQFLLNDEPNRFDKLPGRFTVDSKISYERANFTGFVTIENLTNRKYSTFGILGAEPFLIPAAGIRLFAGLSYRY